MLPNPVKPPPPLPPPPPPLPPPPSPPPPSPPCRGNNRNDSALGTYDYPEGYVQTTFWSASLEINNLGGYCGEPFKSEGGCQDNSNTPEESGCTSDCTMGYNGTQPWLYYSRIGTLRPARQLGNNSLMYVVDLKVEVAPGSTYRPNMGEELNGHGRGQKFGQINMGGRAGQDFSEASPDVNEVTLIFTFMNHATRAPLDDNMLTLFSFTYFDLDMPNNDGRGRECVELVEPAAENYGYEAGSNVAVSEGDSGKKFCANGVGTPKDNPEEPSDASDNPEVKKRAVVLEVRNSHMMKVKYSVACCIDKGRNFVFAGAIAPLDSCDSPPPAAPSPPPSPRSPPSPPSPPSPSPSPPPSQPPLPSLPPSPPGPPPANPSPPSPPQSPPPPSPPAPSPPPPSPSPPPPSPSPPLPPFLPPPPSPFSPAAAGEVWQGSITFDVTVAYSFATSRLPDAADVARAVEKALVDADFKVGDGTTVAAPVRSVAGVVSSSGVRSETFTITLVALATELQRIDGAFRTPAFGIKVAASLREAGKVDISDKPVTVVGGSVMSDPTLETTPRTGTEDVVVLTLTASGSVDDYPDDVKSSLQQNVSNAAGVSKSFVAIAVAAASVRITATITVPASTSADAVRASLASTFGTAAAASAALGITIEEEPTLTIIITPPAGDGSDGGGRLAPLAESEGANQSVADDAVPGWGVFLIVLLLLCCLGPLFGYLYAHFKYGAGKEATWFKWRFSHSNPTFPKGYTPREDREALRLALYEEKKPAATLDEDAGDSI